MNLEIVICKNNTKDLVLNLKKQLQKDVVVKDLYIVESDDDNIVLLICDEEITDQVVQAFWLGYKKALE